MAVWGFCQLHDSGILGAGLGCLAGLLGRGSCLPRGPSDNQVDRTNPSPEPDSFFFSLSARDVESRDLSPLRREGCHVQTFVRLVALWERDCG